MANGAGTHYDVLGVRPDATAGEIKDRYRELAKLLHPDRGGDPVMFAILDESWDVLGDPIKRAAYDASLAERTASTRRPTSSAVNATPTEARRPPQYRPRTADGWVRLGVENSALGTRRKLGDRTLPELFAGFVATIVLIGGGVLLSALIYVILNLLN